jgi:hypothetical protein
MKKTLTAVLVAGLMAAGFAQAGDEAIKGGTIPGAASVGVDLAAGKSAWQNVKEHFASNWGKYTIGIITTALGALVYVNNKGFHGDEKGNTSTSTTALNDESISVSVSGSQNNTINIYSNRDSDNQ